MGVVGDAYQRMMLALLPPGRLWRLVDGLFPELFRGAADELERFDARVADLFAEADPRTATELLAEYERELDLERGATTAERRARILARLIARQRYRPLDFQTALAPLLGQDAADIEVIETTNAVATSMGDVREIFRFFIYRDPTAPNDYFVDAAQDLVDAIKPSHTVGHVIESIDFLCDDKFSLCDRDLLGA